LDVGHSTVGVTGDKPLQFFVYGTLKSDQCRRLCWPEKPLEVRIAWTYGTLFDLGEYPALIEGHTPVWGEVWSFLPTQLECVFRAIDSIECYVPGGDDNLYERVIAPIQIQHPNELQASESEFAWMYRYCHDLSDERQASKVVRNGIRGYHWP